MLAFHEVSLGGSGEIACTRCAVRAHEEPRTSDAMESPDRALADIGTAGVLFTHTGDVERDALISWVRRAVTSGASRIGIRTSGRLLRNEQDAIGLVDAGVRLAEVTFMGPEASQHDVFVGAAGSFDAAVGAVRAFSEAAETLGVRLAVRSRIPVCAHNLQIVPETVMACAQMGVSSMLLVCDPSLDPRRSVEWVSAACDTGTVNRVWVAVTGMPADSLGALALHMQDVMTLRGAHR